MCVEPGNNHTCNDCGLFETVHLLDDFDVDVALCVNLVHEDIFINNFLGDVTE